VTVALYMDVHIPKAITVQLRLSGVDVLTAQEDGRAEVDDAILLDRATELGRVLLRRTKVCWRRPPCANEWASRVEYLPL